MIDGTIPTTLGAMTSLKRIRLRDNLIIGVIPEEIGEATSLERIDFSDNNITGIIPKTIGELPLALLRHALTSEVDGGEKKKNRGRRGEQAGGGDDGLRAQGAERRGVGRREGP